MRPGVPRRPGQGPLPWRWVAQAVRLCALPIALYLPAFHLAAGESTEEAPASSLARTQWIHGSPDCAANDDPPIDTYAHGPASFILRQSKCLSFEAPFIYVLVGQQRILVLDTGDSEDPSTFPLYRVIRSLVGDVVFDSRETLVLHSHNHRDHYRGDAQFEALDKVTLVPPEKKAMKRFLGFTDWPRDRVSLDLGGREIIVLAVPGHQEESIALYDARTGWLLTGDTLYPGLVYVKHWEDYRQSISRLATFAAEHEISAILGSHIEMTREPGEYYPIGTTYQPEEAPLDLHPSTLLELNIALEQSPRKKRLEFERVVIQPMNLLQRTLSGTARLISR